MTENEIPQRSVVTIEISVFPPIPMDDDMTSSMLETLINANKAGAEGYLESLGLAADVSVDARRHDPISEGHTTKL